MKKGISLIVLVITIIVMIIIAGTTIITLSNSNVLSKSKEGRAKNDISLLKQQWQRAYSEALIDTGGVAPTVDQITTRFGASNIPANYSITTTGMQYSGSDAVIIAAATALGVPLATETTPPTLGTWENSATSFSIFSRVTGATDASGIKNYDFYLNGVLIVTQTGNWYSYEDLYPNVNYTIKYVVRDNYDNIATSADVVLKTPIRRTVITIMYE